MLRASNQTNWDPAFYSCELLACSFCLPWLRSVYPQLWGRSSWLSLAFGFQSAKQLVVSQIKPKIMPGLSRKNYGSLFQSTFILYEPCEEKQYTAFWGLNRKPARLYLNLTSQNPFEGFPCQPMITDSIRYLCAGNYLGGKTSPMFSPDRFKPDLSACKWTRHASMYAPGTCDNTALRMYVGIGHLQCT